jgi:hypothetical protein
MNRLKFRVWNPEENKLLYFLLGDQTFPERLLHQSAHPVQQFTGKLDIEGNEIWEGDLVELIYAVQCHPETGEKISPPESFGVYEVLYNTYCASYYLYTHRRNWLQHLDGKSTFPILQSLGICKVIGNKAETPQLLP